MDLHDARLYLVLTPELCRGPIEEVLANALAGGVDLVQLRSKVLADPEFAAMAKRLAPLCRGVPFLLNDRVHLIEATGADGVHVGQGDLAPEVVRERYGKEILVGLSTHDRAEVAAAAGRGADYVGLGPMFDSATKALQREPQGPRLVREVAGATALPVFPIGGIDAATVPSLIQAGAIRVAVSSAICAADDPAAAAAELRGLLP